MIFQHIGVTNEKAEQLQKWWLVPTIMSDELLSGCIMNLIYNIVVYKIERYGWRAWMVTRTMHMERAISNASKPTMYRTIDTLDLVKPRKIQAYYE